MTFLPIVERELRVASRRPMTYWSRFIGASLAIGIATWVWFAVGENDTKGNLSQGLFYTLSVLAWIYCLTAGIGVTADCLSEEKRDGTLGLLFLTDLKGYDVVLGKLAATSLNACYGLLALFPVLALPLLLGGLTFGEFWRIALVLSNTLFFSLSAGILVSAVSYHERKTMIGTFVLILLVSAALPLIGWGLAVRQTPFVYDPRYLVSSPGYSYFMAMDRPYGANPLHYWWSVSIVHGIGWIFLCAAGLAVRRLWQDSAASGRKAAWSEWWHRVTFGGPVARSRFRRRLLDLNPFFWLASRHRLKPVYVMGFLVAAGLVWLWLYWKFRRDMLDPATYVPTAILLHTVLKFWVASEACRPLSEGRRSGALELLLSSPLSVDAVLEGQLLAMKRQFGLAVGLVLTADFVMFLAGFRHSFLESSSGWLMLCAAGMLMFVADLYTLTWVSMWLGVTSKKANLASAGAILRVLVLPTALFLGFMTATVFVNVGRVRHPEDFALGVWFIIGMLNNFFFLAWARMRLREELRTAASQRFDRRGSPEGLARRSRNPGARHLCRFSVRRTSIAKQFQRVRTCVR